MLFNYLKFKAIALAREAAALARLAWNSGPANPVFRVLHLVVLAALLMGLMMALAILSLGGRR